MDQNPSECLQKMSVLSGSCKQGAKAAAAENWRDSLETRSDAQSFSAGWKTNIWRPKGHLRLRPTKGRKPLYWINIKLVQLPKRLTDGGGGPQDVWSECILRSDLSHPSVPWPWTACWIFIAPVEEFFFYYWPVKRRWISLDREVGAL